MLTIVIHPQGMHRLKLNEVFCFGYVSLLVTLVYKAAKLMKEREKQVVEKRPNLPYFYVVHECHVQ